MTYDEAIDSLAGWHGPDSRREDVEIYSFPSDDQIVRLLEISASHPGMGEAWPVRFGKARDFPFISEIILVTPREWSNIQNKRMHLPPGWDLEGARKVWPAA